MAKMCLLGNNRHIFAIVRICCNQDSNVMSNITDSIVVVQVNTYFLNMLSSSHCVRKDYFVSTIALKYKTKTDFIQTNVSTDFLHNAFVAGNHFNRPHDMIKM